MTLSDWNLYDLWGGGGFLGRWTLLPKTFFVGFSEFLI